MPISLEKRVGWAAFTSFISGIAAAELMDNFLARNYEVTVFYAILGGMYAMFAYRGAKAAIDDYRNKSHVERGKFLTQNSSYH